MFIGCFLSEMLSEVSFVVLIGACASFCCYFNFFSSGTDFEVEAEWNSGTGLEVFINGASDLGRIICPDI